LPESILPRGLAAATGELYPAKLHPLPFRKIEKTKKVTEKKHIRKIQKTKKLKKHPNGKSKKRKKD